MHSAECCPVYCFITVLGKGKSLGLTAMKNLSFTPLQYEARNDVLPCWIGPTNYQPKWLRTRSAEIAIHVCAVVMPVIILNDHAHNTFVHCRWTSPVACRFIPSPPQSLHPHECMRVAARVGWSVWSVTDAWFPWRVSGYANAQHRFNFRSVG